MSNEKDFPEMGSHDEIRDLEAAAADYLPDSESAEALAVSGPEEATGPKEASDPGVVSFIRDPFSLPNVEIAEAQANDEELVLDEVMEEELDEEADDLLETDEGAFSALAAAIAEEAEKHAEDLKLLTENDEAQAAERLAREIAEDEALEKQLAQENAEAEAVDPELQAALPKQPVADEHGNLDLAEMESCIEALLFMTDKPMSSERLRELLGPDFSMNVFQEALTSLKTRYQGIHHGFELAEVGGGYQFRTKPGRAALAKKLAKVQTQRLSSGAMESLAIIAYRQPVLKDEIDKIRGVDSSHFIRGLLDKKLIRISGRSELPGRPMLYSTSPEFLELFGLKDLSELPSLRELEQMVPASQSKNPEDEDPRVKEMRRLVGQMKMDTSTTLQYDPREDESILKQIREKVNAIPTSTPYLEQQKELERQAKLVAQNPTDPASDLFEAAERTAEASAAPAPALPSEAAPGMDESSLQPNP